jgi:hypothetical protein
MCAAAAIATSVHAAPAREVTPAGGLQKFGNPNTGPLLDPLAAQGQWFSNAIGQTARPFEFYDNTPHGLGGGFALSQAIEGLFFPIVGGNGSYLGFNIQASITNDLPSFIQPNMPPPGRNSHAEFHPGPELQQPMTMQNVVLTAEFSMLPGLTPPGGFVGEYVAPVGTPIFANAPDRLAWYCYTPLPGAVPGDYYVPSYDFPNIPPGATVTRNLSFTFAMPIDPILASGAPNPEFAYYQALIGLDVFMNRSDDLKIGQWLDILAWDDGTVLPFGPQNAGNVSVFFVPEPSSAFIIIGACGAMLLRRRR